MHSKYCIGISYFLMGWRQNITIVLLGMIAATALPPWFFTPGIFSFAILGFLLSKSTGLLEAARVSWFFSFGFHLIGIHWISNAFLVDSDQFGVFIPFVVVGLPAVLALFPAVILSIFPLIRRSPPVDIVTIAILWSISDFARGKLFTGFPWNLMSYTVSFSENLSQIASVVGAYGLNFLVIFVALAPSILLRKRFYRTKSSFFILFSCCFIPLAMGLGGMLRLQNSNEELDRNTIIRIVQANIPQSEKWDPELKFKNISKYLRLSSLPISSELPETSVIKMIIWPETAIPAFIENDQKLRRLIMSSIDEPSILITGGPAIAVQKPTKLHNSFFVISQTGNIDARYDKIKLVPFGEYVPFKKWLPIPRLVESLADFQVGTSPKFIDIPSIGKIAPLICYEIIFPGEIFNGKKGNRVKLIVNLTNDAWFGTGAGPKQHLEIAKMRAIEEGIPLIRSANTGISGFYDAYGRTIGEIDLNQTGMLDKPLAAPTSSPTIYSLFGDWIYLLLISSFIIIVHFKRNSAI